MKLKVVTLTTDLEHPGLLKLKASLDKFGYDYHIIHQIVPPGTHVFGTQMPHVYNWAKNESEGYTHMLYTDAWDTIALAHVDELLSKFPKNLKFFGSGEKACFPIPELAEQYPKCTINKPWRYVNGGGWIASIEHFVSMYEVIPADGINDQLWLAHRFLDTYDADNDSAAIDVNCEIFQTIAFEDSKDFAITRDKRLINRVTDTLPIFLHGNGRTNMDWVYEFAC